VKLKADLGSALTLWMTLLFVLTWALLARFDSCPTLFSNRRTQYQRHPPKLTEVHRSLNKSCNIPPQYRYAVLPMRFPYACTPFVLNVSSWPPVPVPPLNRLPFTHQSRPVLYTYAVRDLNTTRIANSYRFIKILTKSDPFRYYRQIYPAPIAIPYPLTPPSSLVLTQTVFCSILPTYEFHTLTPFPQISSLSPYSCSYGSIIYQAPPSQDPSSPDISRCPSS